MKKILVSIVLASFGLVTTLTAWADISNNSCSLGKANSSGCHGGNEVGGSPSNDASCCAKSIIITPPWASPGPFFESDALKSAVTDNQMDIQKQPPWTGESGPMNPSPPEVSRYCPGGANCPSLPTEGKIKGKITTTGDHGIAFGEEGGSGTIIAIVAAKMIDVNRASQETLAAIPTIGDKVARAIVTERSKGDFKNAMDMAARMCPTTSIDFGYETAVTVSGEVYSPRGGNPKEPGFKCAVGSKDVELSGRKHNYVGHVTLLR